MSFTVRQISLNTTVAKVDGNIILKNFKSNTYNHMTFDESSDLCTECNQIIFEERYSGVVEGPAAC